MSTASTGKRNFSPHRRVSREALTVRLPAELDVTHRNIHGRFRKWPVSFPSEGIALPWDNLELQRSSVLVAITTVVWKGVMT